MKRLMIHTEGDCIPRPLTSFTKLIRYSDPLLLLFPTQNPQPGPGPDLKPAQGRLPEAHACADAVYAHHLPGTL